ncbi:PHP domain-containing protein [Sporomusa sp.]|uniref:PHP domain-containing protein n=1 Tax=Sporomusa sp. TaxID=2078658 RepID=UPI002BF12E75|nr:PHP domain-containing protein [Sporomusa sp.]HWR43079.1 PHP domain-containing protein [Sporomusa sp.]
MIADLHIHSTASDGRLSPLEIVRQAEDAGLSHIAITDHDTVAAHLELREAGIIDNSMSKLSIIPGIEFSTDLPWHEVHILGYFIDIDNMKLRDQLEVILNDRLRRSRTMVEKLIQLGYSIDYDSVLEFAGQAMAVGRPHVAKVLVENGYFKTVSEAFDVLLAKNGPAYVPHYKLTPEQAIRLIEQAGGIAVLAHPGLIGDDNLVLNMVKAGMRGLEVFHPEHDQAMTSRYLDIANKYNLKITGGSDFHAIPGRYPEKLGEFTISAALVDTLSM